jgi:hypothetical protein
MCALFAPIPQVCEDHALSYGLAEMADSLSWRSSSTCTRTHMKMLLEVQNEVFTFEINSEKVL